jgi:hypothetical protein
VEEKPRRLGSEQEKEMQFGGGEKAVDETRTCKLNFTNKDTLFKHPLFDSIVATSTVQVSYPKSG